MAAFSLGISVRRGIPPKKGERFAPFGRIDVSYNWIDDRIHAVDTRTEVGYGPFGFMVRNTHYDERDPDASLEARQYYGLLRAASEKIELAIGYGRFEINGRSSNSGEGWTLPVVIHPSPRLGIEYRPSWTNINGNDIGDYELAMSYGEPHWAVRGGYRWLKSPGVGLEGPFLGISGWF